MKNPTEQTVADKGTNLFPVGFDPKANFYRLPDWLRMEMQVIVAILRNRSCYEHVSTDLRTEHFFQHENEALIGLIQQHYEDEGQVPTLETLARELPGRVPWIEHSTVQVHMAFLREAPAICECHLINTILWFTTERRVFRGLQDAFSAMEEQNLGLRESLQIFLQACELSELAGNKNLGWLQAAIFLDFRTDQPQEGTLAYWEEHLAKRAPAAHPGATKILWKLTHRYLNCRSLGVVGFDPKDVQCPEVPPTEIELALTSLKHTGLIETTEDGEGRLLIRPTAKALIGLVGVSNFKAKAGIPDENN